MNVRFARSVANLEMDPQRRHTMAWGYRVERVCKAFMHFLCKTPHGRGILYDFLLTWKRQRINKVTFMFRAKTVLSIGLQVHISVGYVIALWADFFQLFEWSRDISVKCWNLEMKALKPEKYFFFVCNQVSCNVERSENILRKS